MRRELRSWHERFHMLESLLLDSSSRSVVINSDTSINCLAFYERRNLLIESSQIVSDDRLRSSSLLVLASTTQSPPYSFPSLVCAPPRSSLSPSSS